MLPELSITAFGSMRTGAVAGISFTRSPSSRDDDGRRDADDRGQEAPHFCHFMDSSG